MTERQSHPLSFARAAIFVGLVLLGFTFVVPFIWQVLISLSSLTDVDLLTQTAQPNQLVLRQLQRGRHAQ